MVSEASRGGVLVEGGACGAHECGSKGYGTPDAHVCVGGGMHASPCDQVESTLAIEDILEECGSAEPAIPIEGAPW